MPFGQSGIGFAAGSSPLGSVNDPFGSVFNAAISLGGDLIRANNPDRFGFVGPAAAQAGRAVLGNPTVQGVLGGAAGALGADMFLGGGDTGTCSVGPNVSGLFRTTKCGNLGVNSLVQECGPNGELAVAIVKRVSKAKLRKFFMTQARSTGKRGR